jgi:glycosyltransferase involved in cell wall biosynthesis
VGLCPLCSIPFQDRLTYDLAVDWSRICTALIPCLNEASAIGNVVRTVKPSLPHILVIDDGSSDTTANVARDAGAEVLRHDRPLGKGAALRAGWSHALHQGFGWALCLDGDGQHAPSDIPKFLTRAERGDVALVSGERMHAPGTMPLVRRCTNRFMSWRLSRLAGVRLPDTQCGFRLLHLPSLAGLKVRTESFEIESELLVQFARAGLGIAFVPIQVIYGAERSKIRPLRDTLRWWKWLREAQRACSTARH